MSLPSDEPDDLWLHDALDGSAAALLDAEDLREGGTHLLDLVAAVDYLARGLRPDFTVWDALEEALAWWLAEEAADPASRLDDRSPAVDDPLAARLRELLQHAAGRQDTAVAAALQAALRCWLAAMAGRYNAGYHWPHPTARRTFPPPLMAQVAD